MKAYLLFGQRLWVYSNYSTHRSCCTVGYEIRKVGKYLSCTCRSIDGKYHGVYTRYIIYWRYVIVYCNLAFRANWHTEFDKTRIICLNDCMFWSWMWILFNLLKLHFFTSAWHIQPLRSLLSSVGGTSVVLGLVAMATTVDNLYASMKALVCIVGNNQLALKEMERTGGFQVRCCFY